MALTPIETEQDAIPALPEAPVADLSFLDEVVTATPGESRLEMCIQCGTCGGSCPSAADMDHTPRQIFAMVRAGMREAVLASNTPWFCVACYYCMVRCPQEVHIPDVMYTLKSLAIRAGLFEDAAGPHLSQTYSDYVERYGRSFEFGLATRHYLRHRPISMRGMAPLGLGMLTKDRLTVTPRRIKGLKQLKAILARARELEAAR
ncbi:MAG TPA: 4Fe-4S dicluster domain-containing protein [Anaerolineae bacterium]|nr:4Fe-4S dicluster domain-containing protein [Anaerolineae bacterium]